MPGTCFPSLLCSYKAGTGPGLCQFTCLRLWIGSYQCVDVETVQNPSRPRWRTSGIPRKVAAMTVTLCRVFLWIKAVAEVSSGDSLTEQAQPMMGKSARAKECATYLHANCHFVERERINIFLISRLQAVWVEKTMSHGGSGHWFWCQGSEFLSQIVQLAVPLWEMYLPFLGFRFFISRMGTGIVLPHRFILRIRCDRDHETNGNKVRRERGREDSFKEGRRTGWTLLWGQEGWRLDFLIQHRWRD